MLKLITWPTMARFVLVCLFYSASSHAAIVHLSGSTVDFFYDDAQPGIANFYGSLIAVGDSIVAQPTNFFAEAVDAGGTDTLSVSGTVTVVAKPGFSFDSLLLAQQGDYILNGAGASVSVASSLDVTDTNNAATSVSSALTGSSDFTLQGTNPWSIDATVDLSLPVWDSVNSIDLSLATLLTADTTNAGEHARIQNKLTGSGLVTVMTTPVPLPASIWLFTAGLGLLLNRGYKSSKS